MTLPRIAGRRLLAFGVSAGAVAAIAWAGAASAAPATGEIRLAGGATAVAGSYIVVLKDGTASSSTVSAKATSLTKSRGGTVNRVYANTVRGFEAKLSESAAKILAADPSVAYIEQNHKVSLADTQTGATWGIDRIDQRALPLSGTYTYSTTASNVHAYVIDTGILTTHSQFGGRATSGYDFVDNDSNATDCNGHGTHVAGTIGGSTYGVAKGVSLVGVRVLDCAGSGTTAGVISGVDWVTANAIKPAVANMSLGGGVSSSLDTAVSNSIAAGVTYGVAAGNDGANACNYSPARVPAAITVGATTSSDARASYSNYGSCLDIFAPGSSITSAWYTSTSATNTISGTSMATPHVVGAAALILAANPSYTPAQVRSSLVTNGTTGVVTSPGTSSPNVLLYTGSGTTTPPPAGCSATNGTDVSIPDAGSAVTSAITISGCARAASSASTVEVHIVHTYRGDLVITLVAPDGSTYALKSSNNADGTNNVDATYTANLSSETANGTWTLRVQDVYSVDTGYLNTWTLTV
jgi:subtilisin family serine protease